MAMGILISSKCKLELLLGRDSLWELTFSRLLFVTAIFKMGCKCYVNLVKERCLHVLKEPFPFLFVKCSLLSGWHVVIVFSPYITRRRYMFSNWYVQSHGKQLRSGCYALHGFENDHGIGMKLGAAGECFWYETHLWKQRGPVLCQSKS